MTADAGKRNLTLGELLPASDISQNIATLPINDLQLDSRKIKVGDVFVVLQGAAANGVDYLPDAFAKGAIAALIDESIVVKQSMAITNPDRPVVPVKNLQEKISVLADRCYQAPSKHLHLTGITGTNGKTSCANYLAQIFHELGKCSAVMGTLGCQKIGTKAVATGMTTPDLFVVQRQLRAWLDDDVTHVALEVSSHALDQGRVLGLAFDIAILTNLTRDHLDYHKTFEQYKESKRKLFYSPGLKKVVINIDDPFGIELKKELGDDIEVLTYSVKQKSANLYASNIRHNAEGILADFHCKLGLMTAQLNVFGEFNIPNILATVGAVIDRVESIDELKRLVESVRAVPGRMQKIPGFRTDISVIVDYAHTPDALKNALLACRAHCNKRLIVVFGCGGDRDQGKRRLMAQTAQGLADQIIVTSDNPRSENPDAIIKDVMAGFSGFLNICSEVDRVQAIKMAIAQADRGDVVLLAGKGHESCQIVGDKKLPFSDVEFATAELQKRQA